MPVNMAIPFICSHSPTSLCLRCTAKCQSWSKSKLAAERRKNMPSIPGPGTSYRTKLDYGTKKASILLNKDYNHIEANRVRHALAGRFRGKWRKEWFKRDMTYDANTGWCRDVPAVTGCLFEQVRLTISGNWSEGDRMWLRVRGVILLSVAFFLSLECLSLFTLFPLISYTCSLLTTSSPSPSSSSSTSTSPSIHHKIPSSSKNNSSLI